MEVVAAVAALAAVMFTAVLKTMWIKKHGKRLGFRKDPSRLSRGER